MKNFSEFHDKYYKQLLIIPLVLLLASLIFLGFFNSQHDGFFNKDISLTGGTAATIQGSFDAAQVRTDLSSKLIDVNTRVISDLVTGEKTAIIIETKTSVEDAKKIIEEYIGASLTEANSSFEFTGSSLSESFYRQLILAVIIAFSFMGWVVFLIFGKSLNMKIITGVIIIISAFLSLTTLGINIGIILSSSTLLLTLVVYLFYSIPSMAVIVSAFADIIMTLALIDIIGVRLSSAGIVAFLMLIGYSVDTDILLTTRILKRNESEGPLNTRIYNAFKTGTTMTLTSLVAVGCAFFVANSFSPVLSQILGILAIGLIFDLINTWITNVSILKWHVLRKK